MSGKTAQTIVENRRQVVFGVAPEAKNAAPPAAQEAAGAALGKNALSFTPPPREKLQNTREQRYFLLAGARALLLQEGKKEGLLYPSEFHKTAKCLHVMRAYTANVHHSKTFNSAFYSGLVTCASTWACPVCAAKIQERRRLEVSYAMDLAYARHLQPVMVTLTFPHYMWQKLQDLIDRQKRALAKLRAGDPWTRFKNRWGYVGLIRSLELTKGRSGWHPHVHELWFVDANADTEKMKEQILARWEKKCIAEGLLDPSKPAQIKAFRKYAVDVKGNCSNSDYLAKMDAPEHWGTDRELVKATSKQGKEKGLHPFGLLANYAQNGDVKAGAAFVEYVQAMRGKAQLFWSPGLKDFFGLKDKSDEEISEEKNEEADLLGGIDSEDWKTVREAKAQAHVLTEAENGGWPAVERLVERLTLAEIKRIEALLKEPDCTFWPSAEPPTQVGGEDSGQLGSGTDPRGISAMPKLGAA